MNILEQVCKEESINGLEKASSIVGGCVYTFASEDKYKHLRINLSQQINQLIEVYKNWK